MPRSPRVTLNVAARVLRVAVGGAVGLALASAPPVREAIIAVEPAIAPGLFIVAMIGAARWWIVDRLRQPTARRRARRADAMLGRCLARWGWAPALIVFVAPIWSHWAQRPPDPLVEFSALLGHVPWGDAHGHIEGGLRLLGDDRFGAYSERRPLHAAWLAARLWMCGGDLGGALILQALVLGFASFILARHVGRRHGVWAGLATLALLQSFARGAVACVVTEPLGMTLAAAGVTILLSHRAHARLAVMALGLLALDAALAARPGPQFLAPALALWAVAWSGPRWKRAAVVLACVLVINAATTRALNGLYGAGEASFSTYPAYTLYGLTHGSNYRQVRADLGDDLSRYGSERDLARLLYQRSFQRLRERPLDLLATLVGNEGKFLSKLPYNLSQTVTLRHFLVRSDHAAEATVGHEQLDLLTALPLLGLALIAALARTYHATRRERWFWVAVASAVLASVPFVYGDAGFRGLASAYPLLSVFLATGLATRTGGRADATSEERLDVAVAAGLALAVLCTSLVLPAIGRALWPRPEPRSLDGLSAGETLVFAPSTSPKVLVARFPREGLSDVPFVERDNAARLIRLSQASLGDAVFSRPGAFVLLSVFDFVSARQQIVLADPGILRIESTYVVADGHFVSEGDVFEARGYRSLAP